MTAIYDQLRVPAYLEPGEYVLGFRYDCETSAQVWNSCAEITISAPVAVDADVFLSRGVTNRGDQRLCFFWRWQAGGDSHVCLSIVSL